MKARIETVRRASLRCSAGALLVLALPLGFSASASAAETKTFKYVDGQQEFKVPAGVTSIAVEAVGAAGASAQGETTVDKLTFAAGGAGGRGAVVTGEVPVTPGSTLYIDVGGAGGQPGGGFNGGASTGDQYVSGGGGGGASDVRTESGSFASRLIVAAGGGGGGAGGVEPGCAGGGGGNAEENGSPSANCPGFSTSEGGKAGGGSLGSGGAPTINEAGGGGGGLFGGGGGNGTVLNAGTSGGGGGSNLVPKGGSAAIAKTGVAASVTLTYTVPPSVHILSPQPGSVFAPGESFFNEPECVEGEGGPGLEICDTADGGITDPALGADTLGGHSEEIVAPQTPGEYSFTDVAKSHDGLEDSLTTKYTVAAPPEATIESPKSGGTYKQGEVVPTSFSCKEGAFGPGLASCGSVKSASSGEQTLTGSGQLNTEELGEHQYTVTATSEDGQAGTSAPTKYTVVSACTRIHGYGRVGSVGEEGVIVADELSLPPGSKETFEAGIQKGSIGEVRLTKLEKGSCRVIPGGREFLGSGPATVKGVPGYTVSFSFAVVGKQITLSLTVTGAKGGPPKTLPKGVIFSTIQTMLPGSVEIIS